MKTWQNEPVQTLFGVVGVALVLVLMWCIGAVAQGQVERAQSRDVQQLHAQAGVLRCSVRPAHLRPAECAVAPAALDVNTAIAVVYR